jgi:hypothetical protein
MKEGKFDASRFQLDPTTSEELRAAEAVPQRHVVTEKMRRRREHFVKVPEVWVERLVGAAAPTYQVAFHLLHLHWKFKGAPIKLATGVLASRGVSRAAKRHALTFLESRGLIAVERCSRKAPIVSLLNHVPPELQTLHHQ